VAKPLDDLCDRLSETVGDSQLAPVSISSGKGFVPQAEKFGRDISGSQYSQYIHLRRGDFAYNRGNSKKFPQGCVYQLTEFDEAAASNAFHCFRLHDDIAPAFISGFFEDNGHGRQLVRHITSGARSNGLLNIGADAFFGISIPIPPTAREQERVADCLASLAELISAERRKLDALRQHKLGLMLQLFSQPGETRPRLRFPEFQGDGEWRKTELNTLARRGTGHTPNKGRSEYYNGGIKWVSLADSKRLDNGLISDTAIELSEEGIRNSSAVVHPAGSVVLSRDAGVGKSAITSHPMAVSQHFVVWTCEPSALSNWFLYYQLQLLKPVFERIATGNTIKTIGLPFFDALRITVPPTLVEQERIAECLCSLDDQLGSQAKKLELLEQHKHGLLQQLFPSLAGPES
jgi:type I restriction enzyme S subunit